MALQQAFDPPDDGAMLTDLVGVAHQLHVFRTLQLTRVVPRAVCGLVAH